MANRKLLQLLEMNPTFNKNTKGQLFAVFLQLSVFSFPLDISLPQKHSHYISLLTGRIPLPM